MKSIKTLFTSILFVSSISWSLTNQLNLYIPEFDNLKNEESLEWLSSGFVDILSKKFNEVDGVRVYGRSALEKILQDKSILLTQRVGTKNILLMGTYIRNLDEVTVNIQIINVSNWDDIGIFSSVSSMSNVPTMGDKIFQQITKALGNNIPAIKQNSLASPFLKQSDIPEMNRQTKEVSKSIDNALENLEEAMDVYIGARTKEEGTIISEGRFTKELNFGNKKIPNAPETKEALLLEEILERIGSNPYDVEINDPKIEIDPESEGNSVLFSLSINYTLKEDLIQEMLRSLPYTGVRQEGSLTTIEFSRDKFPVSGNLNERIIKGDFRIVPIVQLLNNNGGIHTTILDTGDPYWHNELRKDKKAITEHIFSPLVAFTVSGWSLQVTMEAVEITAIYTLEFSRGEISNLSRINVEFVPESELRNFISSL